MTGLSPIQIKLPNVVIGWREEAITFANKKKMSKDLLFISFVMKM
jgi:hypothetical protein